MASLLLHLAFYLLKAALAGLLLCVVGWIILFIVFYAKESIQGSNRPPIAGTIFHLLIHFNALFDFQTAVARRHKTFRLIAPSHSDIYTADPANVEHVLKTNFSKYSKGQGNYTVMRDLFGDGIFAVDGEKWRHQRKLASFEFSARVLRDFSSVVFRSIAAKLAQKISDAAATASVFDMQDLLMKATLDSIFKVGFGVELDTLSGSDELGARFSEAFDDANSIVFWRYVDVLWKVKRRLDVGIEARLKRNIKVIDDFVFQLIRRKRDQMNNGEEDRMSKGDILSRFILAKEKEPESTSDSYLRDVILNFMMAGKDTTANTLTWFFYLLCKHPSIQEKVAAEVEDATKAEGNKSDMAEFAMSLTDEAIDKMQYLHAALTETLRLYPAVPVDGKSADEDDVLPDGFEVKKGDGITYLTYAMGRMTYIWGEDAEDFRPERWIENGSFKPQSPFKFVAFHAGPRSCLGKDFAYRQMKIMAAATLRFFRFHLKDESKTDRYRPMFTLHIRDGLPLLAFYRQI
ncbi:cytochrome P450 704C1 isoform X2 [Musa acuminata AAA Group]|uniref:cytochrome P450 704C1 isoform X2 n=1 Tax=Musa acuminata AAA Group TaxID=214697 RepID=UPI0031CF807F